MCACVCMFACVSVCAQTRVILGFYITGGIVFASSMIETSIMFSPSSLSLTPALHTTGLMLH